MKTVFQLLKLFPIIAIASVAAMSETYAAARPGSTGPALPPD